MSNSLFMDESNGNGLFAMKTSAAAPSGTNNALAITDNGMPASISTDDLSQSLSEYTDADESMSAPTEFLAEFLSAVMLKDYKKALKYCKLILQYEPNNTTAKEFYPLIRDKLKGESSSESDENYNKSSSPSDDNIGADEYQVANESDLSQDGDVDGDDGLDNYSASSSGCGSGMSSRGSGVGIECAGSDSEDATSSDVDENHLEMVSNNSRNSSSAGGQSRSSDNTTHSYSSLLLEDEDDIVPANLHLNKELSSPELDISNGNNIKSTSCSDSESPTEPLTQRLAAILRSKCIPPGSNDGT